MSRSSSAALVSLIAALVLSGCYQSHRIGENADGSVPDAGPVPSCYPWGRVLVFPDDFEPSGECWVTVIESVGDRGVCDRPSDGRSNEHEGEAVLFVTGGAEVVIRIYFPGCRGRDCPMATDILPMDCGRCTGRFTLGDELAPTARSLRTDGLPEVFLGRGFDYRVEVCPPEE